VTERLGDDAIISSDFGGNPPYEKMKAAAEEATDVLETTYSTAAKGTADYGLKMIEAARINTNAVFDYAGELITAKTLSEVIELSSAHARKQFETLTAQGKELGALAQKVALKSAYTIKLGKEAFYRQAEMSLADAYRYTAEVMTENMMARDAEEGIGAFIEKREPKWQDK